MDKKSAIYDKISDLLILNDLEPNERNIEEVRGYLGILKVKRAISKRDEEK